MQKYIVEMSRYITVKQVWREEIDAADEDEVSEIITETDAEDWEWENYDVMDMGAVTINRVTPGESEVGDAELGENDCEDDGSA